MLYELRSVGHFTDNNRIETAFISEGGGISVGRKQRVLLNEENINVRRRQLRRLRLSLLSRSGVALYGEAATKRRFSLATISGLFVLMLPPAFAVGQTACRFNAKLLEFEGSPVDQAKCLLQPVLKGARLGGRLQDLPTPLAALVGQPLSFTKGRFRRLLKARDVVEGDLGGSVDQNVSETEEGKQAQYFVIHDTSSPYLDSVEFPSNINQDTWDGNRLARWAQLKNAHVYVNRVGGSVTAENFSTPWRATKLEVVQVGKRARGRFLHVESVQPRRSDPLGPPTNDLLAPLPGFSDAQLQRLALVYVAASLREGHWLIPAFHAVIDSGFKDGHDDPQEFDLQKWALFVGKLNDELR